MATLLNQMRLLVRRNYDKCKQIIKKMSLIPSGVPGHSGLCTRTLQKKSLLTALPSAQQNPFRRVLGNRNQLHLRG